MATVSGSAQASINDTFTYSSGFNTSQQVTQARSITCTTWTCGTNADQFDIVGTTRLTFTASNAQTIDLTSTLTDPSGTAVNFARVKKILFKFVSPTTDGASVRIKEGASNGMVTMINATNGSGLALQSPTASNEAGLWLAAPNTTGWAVNSTQKTLLITPSAHAITLDILAAGASA